MFEPHRQIRMWYDVSDFEQEVIQRSHEVPVLVDFWAAWCGPCRVLGPILERLAQQNDGRWDLAKVDTEKHVDVAQQYGIQSIPNVKLFVDGQIVDEFLGALPEHAVQRWLQQALPSTYRKQLEQAQQLFRAGKPSEAQPLLEQVVRLEPDNAQARVLLARLVLFNDPKRAAQLLDNVEDPRHLELANAVRTISRLHDAIENPDAIPPSSVRELYRSAIESLFAQDFDTALRGFIEIIRNDRYHDNDGSRKACIAVFKILGEEHEITLKHRRDFSSALYV